MLSLSPKLLVRNLRQFRPSRIPLALQPTLSRAMSDTKKGAVLDASELAEGQMKAVKFEGGEVLLSKINGEIYGAPLEKGVLNSDGRVTCPWHGACFSVCTGDIEDAPGLDSLYKYKAEVVDGKIVVSAPEKELKSKVGRVISRARAPIAATQKETVVIVGGGAGGIHTIESLREHNYGGNIVMLSQEPYAPIDRTKLSKALIDDAAKIEWRTPEKLRRDFGVDLQLSTTVTHVDTEAQTVTTQDGKDVKYDKLVLSPGSVPRRIPIEGNDLEGVVTLRHVSDVKKIVSALGPEADIVVIGTSFIGLEAAGALAKKEHRSLTVVGVDEVPFEAMLGKDIGMAIVKSLEEQGVKFYRGAGVEKISKAEGSDRAGAVHIKDHDPLPASLVIMGTGVAPATEFMKGTFNLEKDGGIAVDDCLRVKGKNNVFAIGDIAHYPQFPHNTPRRVEHWNVAGNHGRHVARTIADPAKASPYVQAPLFWSSVGKGLRYVGTGAKFNESYLDGSADELKFVLYQAENDEVCTVASMGRDPYVAKSTELIREQKMPKLSAIKDKANILDITS